MPQPFFRSSVEPNMRIVKALAVLSLALSIGACGDDGDLNRATAALSKHLTENPPVRGWKILSVAPQANADTLMVDVLVSSDADIEHIKALSRMEQFSVAKLACPAMTPALHEALGPKTRIWVRLQSKKEILTASICPQS